MAAPAMQPQRWVFAGDFEPDSVTKVAEPILVADNPARPAWFGIKDLKYTQSTNIK